MNILIVDDCDMLCEAIGEYLAEKLPDADLDYAYDGDEALRRISELAPSLVVLNIVMPGKTGFDILEQLRADGNNVPVILTYACAGDETLTANWLADERVRAICKPFRIAELTNMARELLSAARSAPPRAKKPRTRTRRWTSR